MPSSDDIARFKRDVRPLGHEEEILEAWGESSFDVPRPPAPAGASPDDAEDLESLEDAGPAPAGLDASDLAELGIGTESSEPGTDRSAEVDFDSFLGDLDLGPGGPDTGPDAAVPTDGAGGADDEFALPGGLLDGLGESLEESTATPGGDEGFSIPDFGDQAGFEDAGQGAGPSERDGLPEAGTDDSAIFATPPDETGGLPLDEGLGLPEAEGFDFEAPLGEAGMEAGKPEADAEEAGFDIPDLEGFGDDEMAPPSGAPGPAPGGKADQAFDDFSMPDFGEEDAVGQPATPATPATPARAGSDDSFAMPDFGESGPSEESFEIGFEEGPPPAAGPAGTAGAAGSSIDDFDAFTSKLGLESGPPSDDLGSFSLDDAAIGTGGGPGSGDEGELAAEAPGGDDLTPADTFNLESSWGSEFRIPGFEETPAPTPARPAGPRAAPGPAGKAGSAPERVREVALSEAQVDSLQDTLLAWPLNLRIAIEDILANDKGSDAQRSALVWMLVEGAAATKAAELAGTILHKRVVIPKGFEKRSGAAFEAEKGSIAWILVNRVLPVAGAVLIALAAAGAFAWLGWRYVWTPLSANAAYKAGYESIRADRYADAEREFARGDALWRMKDWYYRYARAYVELRQYARAEEKYERLLKIWPTERKAALEFADFERSILLDYPKAADILVKHVLEREYFDRDALLMLGDVYLEWGDEERGDWTVAAEPPLPAADRAARGSAPWLYEEARRRYAMLVERHGWKDEYLERMLRYFLRVEKSFGEDQLAEVARLAPDFMDGEKKISAVALGELGGYFLDRDDLESARRALFAADKVDPTEPEIHYQLSRYFRRAADPREELLALRKALATLDGLPLLRARQEAMRVDVLGWTGDNYLASGEYVTARDFFERAIAAYEDALKGRRLGLGARFGIIYARLADILYSIAGDDEQSLRRYEQAERTGYATNETRYRRAVVLYRLDRLEEALIQAHRAALDVKASPALLLLEGNALAARGDWFAAQAAFYRLVDELKLRLDRIPLLLPQERPAQGELVELLMRGENNLGVAYWRLSGRTGDASLRAKAMAAFAESMRLFDNLERDQATMIRPAVKNLAFLNMDFLLKPRRGIELSIYPDVVRDLGK